MSVVAALTGAPRDPVVSSQRLGPGTNTARGRRETDSSLARGGDYWRRSGSWPPFPCTQMPHQQCSGGSCRWEVHVVVVRQRVRRALLVGSSSELGRGACGRRRSSPPTAPPQRCHTHRQCFESWSRSPASSLQQKFATRARFSRTPAVERQRQGGRAAPVVWPCMMSLQKAAVAEKPIRAKPRAIRGPSAALQPLHLESAGPLRRRRAALAASMRLAATLLISSYASLPLNIIVI